MPRSAPRSDMSDHTQRRETMMTTSELRATRAALAQVRPVQVDSYGWDGERGGLMVSIQDPRSGNTVVRDLREPLTADGAKALIQGMDDEMTSRRRSTKARNAAIRSTHET